MKQLNEYFNYALLILFLYISFLVVKPFISVIILSLVLAYMVYPLQKILRKKLSETISATILTIALVLIILIPILILGNALLDQASKLYISTNQDTFEELLNTLNISKTPQIQYHLNQITKNVTSFLISWLASFILSIPNLIINFFIALVVIFFGLKDGSKIVSKIIELFPIKENYKKLFVNKITFTIESLFYGTLALSLIEGIVATIGFYFLGVSNPLIWGLAIIITAILPAIGATFVWLPIALIAFIQGNTTQAIFIALFGSIVLSTLIDTFLRAKILGYRAKIHPLIIIIGVLGGVAAFGITGIIIGPLILSLLEQIISIYLEIKNEA